MLRSSTFPTPLDTRDFSYHRSFGATAPTYIPDFSVDSGKTDWNQNVATPPAFNIALPMGCTGMTQADNLIDQYGGIISPETIYRNTCDYEGHGLTQGCQIRNSLKMTQAYTIDFVDGTTESVQSRGGKYFNIYDDGVTDWFDGIAHAVYSQNVGASLGTPWFPSWMSIGRDGELPMPSDSELEWARNSPYSLSWHNYAAKGKEGDALQVKPWIGGFRYMPRKVANVVMEIRGSAAFIQPKYAPADLFTIKLSILDTVLHKYLRMLKLN